MILGRGPGEFRKAAAWPGYVWLGTMFLFLVAWGAADFARAAVGCGAPRERRRAPRARAPSVSGADGGCGSDVGRRRCVRVCNAHGAAAGARSGPVSIRLDRLPAALHGFSIVQLTDIHVGPTIGRRFVEDVVARTNALEPDLVAITGDLVDGHVRDLAESIAPLAQLRARHGVFFVTGNHEYFSGADAWVNELTRIGIRVLQNERVVIGNGAASFDLAGVDDPSAVHYGGLAPHEAVARALARTRFIARAGVAGAPARVRRWTPSRSASGCSCRDTRTAAKCGRSGWSSCLQQPFTAGLHRHRQSQVYVSRGTGYWGPPMRLAAPSEITHVRLESARAATDRAPGRAGPRPKPSPCGSRRARTNETATRAPTCSRPMIVTTSAAAGTSRSPTAVMTSPGRRPARAAGVPCPTRLTSAPSDGSAPSRVRSEAGAARRGSSARRRCRGDRRGRP